MIGHDLSKKISDNKQRAMMQYDKNFAYMHDNKVVVLQPQKPATTYTYSNNQLVPCENDEQLVKKALAHANLGNLAYTNGWYH